MRHQKSGRKLNRNSTHRKAMFSNMVASLIKHGRIETTEAKAKELRRFAEPTINWAVQVADIEMKGRKKQTGEEKAKIVHAIRMAKRVLKDKDALSKLFHEVGPGFATRSGGYTRVLKTRNRVGDAAPMAFVELMPAAAPKKTAKKAPPKADKAKAADKAEAAPKVEAKAEKAPKKKAAPKAEAKAAAPKKTKAKPAAPKKTKKKTKAKSDDE
jgi:large subunit ribosomal protein L17